MRCRESRVVLLIGFALAHTACSGNPRSVDVDLGPKTSFPNDPADPSQDAAIGAGDASPGVSDASSSIPPRATGPATAELLISRADGTVMWWRAGDKDARLVESSGEGPAFGMAFDASGKLYVTHGYTADLRGGNAIEVFDAAGNPLGKFGVSYDCNPHSIVFDARGSAYVGQSDCEANILHLDAKGAVLESFDVAREERGSDWIALADDQCTMLYASQGPNVKRYDVCERKQLTDLNAVTLPVNGSQGSGAQQLKFVPGGGVLVANFTEILRLDAAGKQVRVYDMAGPDGWRGLDLDADGRSFWAVNHSTSDVVRFEIASGDVLELFNTGTAPLTLKSVVVKRP